MIKKGKFYILACVMLIWSFLFPLAAAATTEKQPMSPPLSYVALGDSLAAGIQSDSSQGLGYSDYLAQKLESIDYLGAFTKSFAVPGYTSNDVREGLKQPQQVQAIAEADIVTISVGANDFLKVWKENPEHLQDPNVTSALFAKLGENYTNIVKTIHKINPSSKVYIMGYYNAFYAYPEAEQQNLVALMHKINQLIESVTRAEGQTFVPTFSLIEKNYPVYLPNPENIHPGSEGYKVITSAFWEAMKEELPVTIKRIAGKDRYETAIAISQEGWEASDIVVLARGDTFPDALAGAPLAHLLDAPILLTKPNELLESVSTELHRLNAKKVYVLGGPGALAEEHIFKELERLGYTPIRVAGKDRYETAVRIAEKMEAEALGSSKTAIVANGSKFPDALSAASYAAETGTAIYLTKAESVPEITKTALAEMNRTLLIGGPTAISEKAAQTMPNTTRYAGVDRYQTSVTVTRELNPSSKVFLATGETFADALTGSVLAAKWDYSFLLVPPHHLHDSIETVAEEMDVFRFTILGGEGAINPAYEKQLTKIRP